MMSHGRSRRHPGRALAACLALVANLFAAGVPVLHAWAHDAHVGAHTAQSLANAAGDHQAPRASAAGMDADHHAGEAHLPGHEHAPPAAAEAAAGDDHPHDAIHPRALHEDALLVHRPALDGALAPPAARPELLSFTAEEAPALHAVSPVPSRAPPSADLARAPPLS